MALGGGGGGVGEVTFLPPLAGVRDGVWMKNENWQPGTRIWKPGNTMKKEEQIGTRQDESQWIVAQRPLSAPTIPRFDWIVCPGFPRPMMRTALNTDPFNGLQGTCDIRPKPFTLVPVLMGRKGNTAYQHGF